MREATLAAAFVSLVAQNLPAQSLYERPVPGAPTRTAPSRGPSGQPAPASGGHNAATPAFSAPWTPEHDPEAPAPMQTPEPAAKPASAQTTQTAQRPRITRPTPRAPQLLHISLFAIEAPEAREFAENDLVTIIISERSKTQRNQKLESKKEYDLDAKITAWIRLMELLEARAVPDGKSQSQLPSVGAELESDFKGDGKYGREDTLTDRIQARVVEVKPNGTLLLEARRSLKTDEEGQEVVLSGMCRQEDITDSNTVQSNQLYDLQLNVQNTGQVKKAGEKGLIPRVLDGLFNL